MSIAKSENALSRMRGLPAAASQRQDFPEIGCFRFGVSNVELALDMFEVMVHQRRGARAVVVLQRFQQFVVLPLRAGEGLPRTEHREDERGPRDELLDEARGDRIARDPGELDMKLA